MDGPPTLGAPPWAVRGPKSGRVNGLRIAPPKGPEYLPDGEHGQVLRGSETRAARSMCPISGYELRPPPMPFRNSDMGYGYP